MELLGDVGQEESRFGPFRNSARLVQDRCKVCTELTIGSKTILDAPDGTPR
jgi:hypothetical protein